jgi:TPR repeat protein
MTRQFLRKKLRVTVDRIKVQPWLSKVLLAVCLCQAVNAYCTQVMTTMMGSAKLGVNNIKAETQANTVWAEYAKAYEQGKPNSPEARRAWSKMMDLVKEGNVYAQNYSACLLANGKGMGDAGQAMPLFKEAAQKLALAQYNYGLMLSKKNLEEGMTQIKQSYERSGLEQAGVRLMMASLSTNKLPQALTYANELLSINNPTAMYVKARIDFTQKNYRSSFEMAQKATEAYELNAPLLLATHYQNGLGVDVDPVAAASWKYVYRKMADTNSRAYVDPGNDPAITLANRWLSTHSPGPKIEYQLPLCQMGRVVLKPIQAQQH